MKKQLILLRHAKSDWDGKSESDFVRPLSARGRSDAPRMGGWLRENGYTPECIVSSPSVRTTQTVELVCAAVEYSLDRVIYEPSLYHGSAAQICELAAEQLEKFKRVLIVGHNPGMERAVLEYCPATKPFADGKIMPTCTAAVIELAAQDGYNGGGNLLAWMRPSALPHE